MYRSGQSIYRINILENRTFIRMIFENKLRFISLSSGSNGNCYYIGNDLVSILIDAGVGCRTLKKGLAEHGIDINDIDMVFVTHDHIDHIRHLSTLIERYGKPVFTTRSIHKIGRASCRERV